MFLIPRVIYKDPFRQGENIMVLCDTWVPPQVKEDNTLTEMSVSFVCSFSKQAAAPC